MEVPAVSRSDQGDIVPFIFKRDYSDLIMIEIDRFDQPMTKTLLSFLKKRYGDDFWYAIDISGNQSIDCYLIAGPEEQNDIPVIHIYSIAIRREFEGNGWSRKLMVHLIGQAKLEGKKKIILEVRNNNPRAIMFYEKLGFTRTGIVEDYYKEGVDALNYELVL